MNTESFHAHAGSYRVNTVVVCFHGYLGSLTRDAGNTLNGNQSVGNLGDLLFEQPLKEHW